MTEAMISDAARAPELVRVLLWARRQLDSSILSEYRRDDPSSSFIRRQEGEIAAIDRLIAAIPEKDRTPPDYRYPN